MINGKQIIQDTIDWLKVKASTIPSQITDLVGGNPLFIKEQSNTTSLVLGSGRYNQQVKSISRTLNVVTITFVNPQPILNNVKILLKSNVLGITNWTLVTTETVTFPNYPSPYFYRFTQSGSNTDIVETLTDDVQFISFADYLNSLEISEIKRLSNEAYITFENPHLIMDATSFYIDCPLLGLTLDAQPTASVSINVNTLTFKFTNSNPLDVTFTTNLYAKFYVSNGASDNSANANLLVINPIKKRYDLGIGSNLRGIAVNGYIDYKQGERSARGITSSLNILPTLQTDSIEYILPAATNYSNFSAEGFVLPANRPRINQSTVISGFLSTLSTNVAPAAINFYAGGLGATKKILNVRRHTTVVRASNTVTVTTSTAHFFVVGHDVTVFSSVLGATVTGTILTVTSTPTHTFTFTNAGVDVSGADTGYCYRTGTSSVISVVRASNVVTITTEIAHGIISGSWIGVTSSLLGLSNTSYIARNVTTTAPFTIQFEMTGSDVSSTTETDVVVVTTDKHSLRTLTKHKTTNTLGWFIAGTDPLNTTSDFYFYDNNNVGFFANMPAPTSTLPTWNFFVPLNNTARSKFGRYNYFGNLIPTIAYPNDVNVVSEGAIVFGNTTTGTPIDGTLSKITNGDANYFSNGNWRGLLHVLGGSGANTNIVTNTANALMKFVGTGLQAISSLITDNGTFLKYNGDRIQRTKSNITGISNINATDTLGHSYTLGANTTEIGSIVEFETTLVKNAAANINLQLSVLDNGVPNATNGTNLLGNLGTFTLSLSSGSVYIAKVIMVRDTGTSWKITTSVNGTTQAGGGDEIANTYVTFTNAIANTLSLSVQLSAQTANTVTNQVSTLKY